MSGISKSISISESSVDKKSTEACDRQNGTYERRFGNHVCRYWG
jgi:hypothetical protein